LWKVPIDDHYHHCQNLKNAILYRPFSEVRCGCGGGGGCCCCCSGGCAVWNDISHCPFRWNHSFPNVLVDNHDDYDDHDNKDGFLHGCLAGAVDGQNCPLGDGGCDHEEDNEKDEDEDEVEDET
jgi:hypothetical protein